MHLYAQSGYLKGFDVGLRTLDIDFLIKNMRRPAHKVNLALIASENGYTIDHDCLNGTTKIYTPDLMEIDFLIEQKGSGTEAILPTNLGVNAQALHHVSLLKQYSINISILGMEITVPEPEAYVIHKMIINGQRGRKSEKDQEAIARLRPYLNQNKYNEIFGSLSRKEKKLVETYNSI